MPEGEDEAAADKAAADKAAAEHAAADKVVKDEAAKEAAAKAAKEKPEDMITRANAAAMRIEEANKVQAELLEKRESMAVESALGGTTEAGTGTKEETPTEYKDRILRGEDVAAK